MSDINLIPQQGVREVFENCCLSYGNIIEDAGTAGKIDVQNALVYRIGGQVFTRAAGDTALTANTAQANGTTCYYLLSVDASGNVTCTKGDDDSTTLPDCPADEAPFGVMKVVATAAFTSGTTDLGGQGTFAHISFIPADNDASALTYA